MDEVLEFFIRYMTNVTNPESRFMDGTQSFGDLNSKIGLEPSNQPI